MITCRQLWSYRRAQLMLPVRRTTSQTLNAYVKHYGDPKKTARSEGSCYIQALRSVLQQQKCKHNKAQ